jgi:hypothetical protein
LHAHRAAFATLIAEITDLAEANRGALRDACATSERNLDALNGSEMSGSEMNGSEMKSWVQV